MSDAATAPLLRTVSPSSPRPGSHASRHSQHSAHKQDDVNEDTPLLQRGLDGNDSYDAPYSPRPDLSRAEISLRWLDGSLPRETKKPRKWPVIVASVFLCLAVIVILCLGFAAPEIIKQYTEESVAFDASSVSIDSYTTTGVNARIQGTFLLDPSKVQKPSVRYFGRVGTWIARKVKSEESQVKLYLPEYGNFLLGTATIPPVEVNIRSNHLNKIDLVAAIEPGAADGLKKIAQDWFDGRIAHLNLRGRADVKLRSGIFDLGSQSIARSITLRDSDIPVMPKYNITRINIHDNSTAGAKDGMAADVLVTIENDYPVEFTVPPLGFDILVPNCLPAEPRILVAEAVTRAIQVKPKQDIDVQVAGSVRDLPDSLTDKCPNSHSSPLDIFLGSYIHGDETTIYIQGSHRPSKDTPNWIKDLISSITIPIPFRGHTFEGLIRNFSLANVHFALPDSDAEPGSPDAAPKVSATIKAIVGLPKEMNFALDVSRVRANAEVYYRNRKLGRLDLHKWQDAKTTRLDADRNGDPALSVVSKVNEAPLEITDEDLFSEIVQKILFSGENIVLGIKAAVDVQTETTLGKFVIREIPAEGSIPIHSKNRGGFDFRALNAQVGSLKVLKETTKTKLVLQAKVNFTNPTFYSADIPYAKVHVLSNGTVIASVVVEDALIRPGNNTDVSMLLEWDPRELGGDRGAEAGRELMSKYISGFNTSITLQTYPSTLPGLPIIGKALSHLPITLDLPRIRATPDDDHKPDEPDSDVDPDGPQFIQDTTMHLLSSTASFTLISPLQHTTITINSINATALYNHTHPVGHIFYNWPLTVPPGRSRTPRLPVDWSLDGVGYDAVRKALGGSLKLDTVAEIEVGLGEWECDGRLWFIGRGLGVTVRL